MRIIESGLVFIASVIKLYQIMLLSSSLLSDYARSYRYCKQIIESVAADI